MTEQSPSQGNGSTVESIRPREISVLVPVSERPCPLGALYEEFARPLREAGYRFEFIFLVEPDNAALVPDLKRLQERGEPIKVVQMGYPSGDTALLRVGEEIASFDVLVNLPAYPRIEASELPNVIRPVLEGASMSVARRWPRRDSWLNRLQNRAFHLLVRSLGGQRLRDVACGVRAVDRSAFEALPLYGSFHRFLPLLALRAGYRVVEVDAAQHPGDWQPRMRTPGVYVRRLLDVFGLFFLMRFTDRPLRFFGLVGVTASALGGLILLVLLLQRIEGQPLSDRPMLLLGALLVVLGVQAIALGLVGEIVVHLTAPHRSPYRLKDHVADARPPSSSPSVRAAESSSSPPGGHSG